jgi:hypothetical protein
MTRISSLASNTSLLQQIFRTRSKLFDLETQIGSGKVSSVYSGISSNSERLINQENTLAKLTQFIENNEQMDLRLNIGTTAVQGVREVIRDFRNAMLDYNTSDKKDESQVKDIQANAFRSMGSLEGLLNTGVDGRFLFSGARIGTQPVNFGLTSLSDFQNLFDGSRTKVATTRDAHLENFSFNKDSGTTAADWLKFERNVGAAAQVDTITVAGTVVEVGDIFSVVVNGTSFSFTAADTVANNVAIGLANAVNADGPLPVTASSPSGGSFTLTADVVGTAFTSTVTTTETDLSAADAQTISTVPTTANVPGGSLVTASSAEFTNVTVGAIITITGTGGVNDGTYEVVAKTGTTLSIRTEQLTDEAANPVVITFQDPADSTRDIVLNTTMAFTRSNNTMVRSVGDAISAIPAGTKITISSASTNNASFTVKTNDGTNLVIESQRFTDQGTSAAKYFQFTAAGAPNDIDFVDGGASADTLVAPANTFQDAAGNPLPVGTKLVIAGTGTANDGNTYTIASVSTNKSTVTLVSTNAVTAAATVTAGTVTAEKAAGTITSTSYFNGDQTSLTHRVDVNRSFEYDLNAVNPGFEKAIRAMKITMQGIFQSEGGLDQNTDRIDKILFLLDSALVRDPGGAAPFGIELTGNIEQMELDFGFDRILIDATNSFHRNFNGFLGTSIGTMENINVTESITLLLNQQQALEASFQVFARIRQLSLSNFLPV